VEGGHESIRLFYLGKEMLSEVGIFAYDPVEEYLLVAIVK
jgi:hypothetical protein